MSKATGITRQQPGALLLRKYLPSIARREDEMALVQHLPLPWQKASYKVENEDESYVKVVSCTVSVLPLPENACRKGTYPTCFGEVCVPER